ncbi:circadian clock-controlled protein daywake, partial [Aphomia sociella]
LVNTYRPCNDKSPECLKATIQSVLPRFMTGVPEYGVISMDPFLIENLDLNFPGNLKGHMKNGWAKGLKKCVVDSASLVGDVMDTVIHCNLTIKGKYKTSGRLLLFVVNGEGDSTVKCVNLKIHNKMKLGYKVNPDGQKYLTIRETKTDHSYDGRVTYDMKNLFSGSPETTKIVLAFMNENWQMVAEEFGDPIIDVGVSAVLRNIKNFFNNVPYYQLLYADF